MQAKQLHQQHKHEKRNKRMHTEAPKGRHKSPAPQSHTFSVASATPTAPVIISEMRPASFSNAGHFCSAGPKEGMGSGTHCMALRSKLSLANGFAPAFSNARKHSADDACAAM